MARTARAKKAKSKITKSALVQRDSGEPFSWDDVIQLKRLCWDYGCDDVHRLIDKIEAVPDTMIPEYLPHELEPARRFVANTGCEFAALRMVRLVIDELKRKPTKMAP